MNVGGDRFAFLQVRSSEPIDRQHDEGRADEAEEHKDDKYTTHQWQFWNIYYKAYCKILNT